MRIMSSMLKYPSMVKCRLFRVSIHIRIFSTDGADVTDVEVQGFDGKFFAARDTANRNILSAPSDMAEPMRAERPMRFSSSNPSSFYIATSFE